MLSLTRDLLRKTRDKNALEIKPLTVCFWSDFAANPAVMYGLFEAKKNRLIYDPEKVNVIGSDDGICELVFSATCFRDILVYFYIVSLDDGHRSTDIVVVILWRVDRNQIRIEWNDSYDKDNKPTYVLCHWALMLQRGRQAAVWSPLKSAINRRN